MDLGAFGRIAAGVTRTLVVAGVLPIAGPLRVDDQQAGTSHRDHRGRNRLIALLAAGLLVAACSADGRSTVSPPVPPDPTATTIKRIVPAAPKVPTTAPPRSAPAVTAAADRLAAQLTTAETAIRDPATPAGKLPTLGHTQQRAYRALVRQPQLVPKVLAQLPPTLRRVVQANVLAGRELRKLNGPARPAGGSSPHPRPGTCWPPTGRPRPSSAFPGSTWPPSTWSRPDSAGSGEPARPGPRGRCSSCPPPGGA